MAIIYKIEEGTGLIAVEETPTNEMLEEGAGGFVEVYSLEEFSDVDLGDDDVEKVIAHLAQSEGSFANILPDCIIGSFAFPDHENPDNTLIHCEFYLTPKRLIIINSDGNLADALELVRTINALPKITTARVLFEFVKHFIHEDPLHLAVIAKDLGDVEDQIIDHHSTVDNQKLLNNRRQLTRYNHLYQQLTDMANFISKDDYLLLSKSDRRLFRLLSQQTERLFQQTQYLKEYSLQLGELYQVQLDSDQNKTIRWLTVVTTIVVPLMLLTSWYGMNFHMPEVEWPYTYLVLLGVCIILVIVQLIFFKKRKWL